MEQELRNEDVWSQCGFERPPSWRTLDQFITNFELVAEDVFIELVHELAEQVPLGKLFRINGTDILVDHRDDVQWNYDHAEDDFFGRYSSTVIVFGNERTKPTMVSAFADKLAWVFLVFVFCPPVGGIKLIADLTDGITD